MKKTILGLAAAVCVAAFATIFAASTPAAAKSYPDVCTTKYNYSAACCERSYGSTPAGGMNNMERHEWLKACTARGKKSSSKSSRSG